MIRGLREILCSHSSRLCPWRLLSPRLSPSSRTTCATRFAAARRRPPAASPSNQVLQLDLVLPLRDPAGLESFLKQLYNPASPTYRQFLTPPEFTARFGPTQENYDAVVRFAKTYGFEVVRRFTRRQDVQVKGTVAAIEAAFHVNMRTYQHPTENRDVLCA